MLTDPERTVWFWVVVVMLIAIAGALLRYREAVTTYVRHRSWARVSVSIVIVCLLSLALLIGLLPQKSVLFVTFLFAPAIGFLGGYVAGRRLGVFLIALLFPVLGEILIPLFPEPPEPECLAFMCIDLNPARTWFILRVWRFMSLIVPLTAYVGYREALHQHPELQLVREARKAGRHQSSDPLLARRDVLE